MYFSTKVWWKKKTKRCAELKTKRNGPDWTCMHGWLSKNSVQRLDVTDLQSLCFTPRLNSRWLVNLYPSQLVPIFGQLVPVLWSTHTPKSTRTYFGQLVPVLVNSYLLIDRYHHSEPFQVPYARTDGYRHSFFPETIRDWNALPASTVSSAEFSEDCSSRFTSLMRSRE